MPDLYLEPYDGPSADEFMDFDRPYQELSEEEEEALIEKMAIGADNWLMDCEGCTSVMRYRDKYCQRGM